MGRLDEAISELSSMGFLRVSRSPHTDIPSQVAQYKKLLSKAENAPLRTKYLHHYDANLRLIEILLLQRGYLLDAQPHATARKIVAVIDPSCDFRSLSQVRHDAKKENIEPMISDLNSLLQLQDKVRQLAEKHF